MFPLLAILLAVQFLFVATHDFLDIPGLHYGSQVRRAIGPRKLLLATAINASFPAVAAGSAMYFLATQRPQPAAVTDCQLIYCAVTLVSAVAMWWVPYFRGASPETRGLYAAMYANTRHVLPPVRSRRRQPAAQRPPPGVPRAVSRDVGAHRGLADDSIMICAPRRTSVHPTLVAAWSAGGQIEGRR
jgi:hypothetical protein